MAHRHFEGVLHAQLYGKFRPIPPVKLIQRIVSFLKEKYNGPLETAYDVGCGSGQSTTFFASHFKSVVGTDISPEQIKIAAQANTFPNISYVSSPAEKFNLSNNSIQLITACQAAHWFDLPAFYKEAHRVLDHNAVLSLIGYEFSGFRTPDEQKNKLLCDRLLHFYSNDLRGYWDEYRKLVDRKYQDPGFQFGVPGSSEAPTTTDKLFWDFTREDGFNEDTESTLRDYVSYCLTWSGWNHFKKVNGEEKAMQLIHNLEKDFLEILGTTDPAENIKGIRRTTFFLLLGRK